MPDSSQERKETVNEFLGRVAQAQIEGEEYIEAEQHLIDHFNRKGLNGAKYFIYQGIKIMPKGQAEAILEEENTPLIHKLHGRDGGTPEGLD